MRIAVRHSLLGIAIAGATALGGCTLDPLVSDEAGTSIHILPPGTAVPHVSSDLDLSRQIRINDGLSDSALEEAGGVLALKSGWAAGAQVKYWDFGNAPAYGALLYVLVRKNADETVTPVAHPWLAAALPGDPGYSPFWYVQYVPVTDLYQGEILSTIRAITDAVELGLIEEPYPAELYLDGPIVAAGTTLDMGTDQPTKATIQVLARGYMVDMFALGGAEPFKELARAGRMTVGDVHVITEGTAVAALKAPLFQNGVSPWTPFVRVINCRVTASNPDDPTTAVHDEAQLFTRDMMGAMTAATSRVITWATSTTTKNWPILVTQ